MAKKYDPLWELVGEKVPLVGAEPDIDSHCPNCHVRVHVGPDVKHGDTVECGLCGAVLEVVTTPGGIELEFSTG